MYRLVRSTERGELRTLEYEFSGTGNCRWQFDTAASGQIVAWRYPDPQVTAVRWQLRGHELYAA